MKFLPFPYLLLIFFSSVSGQAPQPILTTYTSADGLSFSNVNNAQFDHHGFLWIATNYGLNRFDGIHFINFFSLAGMQNNGLSGNVVKKVVCDSLVMWVAIDNGGINCYFDRIDHFSRYIHDPGDSASLVSNSVNCLHLSRDKKLYVGTAEGLSIFNREATHFTNIIRHPVLKEELDVTSFAESKAGIIWIGTNKQGLLYYNNHTGIHVASSFSNALQSTIINDVMCNEEENELWLATTKGLWRASINSDHTLYNWRKPITALDTTSVLCVRKNAEGDIWTGTLNDGLYLRDRIGTIFHYATGNSHVRGLLSNEIKDISFGTDGSVWISTPKGLQAYHKTLQQFPFFKTNIYFNHASLPASPFGLSLWHNYIIAATNQGVWVSDTNFLKSYSIVLPDDKNEKIRFINTNIIDDKIFVSGSNGVYQLTIKNNQLKLIRPDQLQQFREYITKPCHDIIKANDSVFCIACNSGRIYVVNIKTGKTDTIFMHSTDHMTNNVANAIMRLYKDKKGRVLVGTNYGIFIYTNSNKLVKTDYDLGAYNHNSIDDFYDDGKDIWVATAGTGFFRCDSNLSIIKQYTTEDGLCDNTIHCIQPDEKGNLWLTTNRGLSVFDTTLKKISNYYQRHGLPSQEFNLFGKTAFQNHTLYFSTTEGIIQVHPYNWDRQSPFPLHLKITKVVIGNEIMELSELAVINELLTLSGNYGKNIALSFGVINFLNLYDYTLQYKLSDNDRWLDIVSGAEILLSSLSPGVHQLHVRGIAKSENRTGESLILRLYIKPAWYQQWWFIALVCLISSFIVYAVYKYRINQIKTVIALRTKISQDLHDNVGSALSSISIFSQAAIQKNEVGNTADSKNILERIGETSREVMGELNDTVWLINPRNDNMQKIIQRISNYALPLCRTNNIYFEINAMDSVKTLDLTVEKRKAIYLIIKEAVNNSLKYAAAKNLAIQFEKIHKTLHISIKDDGSGFDENNSSAGNGLNNMNQRAKDVKGKIDFISAQQKGTEIILQIPLTNIGD